MDKIGIYIIYFNDPDKCYIGQSTHMLTRMRKHKEMLRSNTHYNYKLQAEFNRLKVDPNSEILQECTISELDSLEIIYINEFNSIINGYNIIPGGSTGCRGVNSARSIYTREELLSIFLLLTNENLTNKDIHEITELPMSIIETIAYDRRHAWLSEEFPEERKKINNIISNRLRSSLCNDYNARNGIIYTIVSPDGIDHKFSNIAKFARDHGLNQSHLNQLVLGKETQHKKWKMKGGVNNEL